MQVNRTNTPNFGYKSKLKTLWKKNKFPSVKKGFYGGDLTFDNVTLEHLKLHSRGGKNTLSNFVLATDKNNQLRANFPLKMFADKENILNYLEQFKNIRLPDFDGNKYIQMIIKTIGKLGIEL